MHGVEKREQKKKAGYTGSVYPLWKTLTVLTNGTDIQQLERHPSKN